MTIRIGNASAPRWYDLSSDRLEEYIERLVEWGATSTELVLHAGESDEPIRRVHVLEQDWFDVFESYRSHGLICHAHAPLHPRFKLDRWATDPDVLKADLRSVLSAAALFTERQGEPCVLVLHGASGPDAENATAGFLSWAESECGDARLSLELRNPKPGVPPAFDRSRAALAAFVEWTGNERLGICWDVAHDWESAGPIPGWTPSPEESFTRLVNHVHLHDIAGAEQISHIPLQSGRVPWRSMLQPLIESGYQGAITMEIRYRCALALGEPWSVLGGSYSLLSSYLRQFTGDAVQSAAEAQSSRHA